MKIHLNSNIQYADFSQDIQTNKDAFHQEEAELRQTAATYFADSIADSRHFNTTASKSLLDFRSPERKRRSLERRARKLTTKPINSIEEALKFQKKAFVLIDKTTHRYVQKTACKAQITDLVNSLENRVHVAKRTYRISTREWVQLKTDNFNKIWDKVEKLNPKPPSLFVRFASSCKSLLRSAVPSTPFKNNSEKAHLNYGVDYAVFNNQMQTNWIAFQDERTALQHRVQEYFADHPPRHGHLRNRARKLTAKNLHTTKDVLNFPKKAFALIDRTTCHDGADTDLKIYIVNQVNSLDDHIFLAKRAFRNSTREQVQLKTNDINKINAKVRYLNPFYRRSLQGNIANIALFRNF